MPLHHKKFAESMHADTCSPFSRLLARRQGSATFPAVPSAPVAARQFRPVRQVIHDMGGIRPLDLQYSVLFSI
jgi:hypothetical protein